MKKIIMVIFAAFLFGTSVLAQGVSCGIKGGLNLANQTISGSGLSLDTKTLIGFHAGVYATVMFTENVGVQPEILYSVQGSKFDFNGTTTTTRINYINVPILFRYNINDMISVHAGPQIGFVASAKSDNGNNTTDIKDNVNSTDIALAFGATIDLPMKLNFTARYCLGLSDIDKSNNSTSKNLLFQLGVGYKLF